MKRSEFGAYTICSLLFIVLFVSVLCFAFAEHEQWNCPECGRTGNTGNYCGGCAHPAPWIEVEKNEDTESAQRDMSAFRIVSSIVAFGHYEQDDNTDNGAETIEWIVLDYDKTKNRTLLLSQYGLDTKPYNSMQTNITWENSSLRKWLNEEFLNTAFTAEEQSAILITYVDNSMSQGCWNTDGGNNTTDKIFLLSFKEANRYLGVTTNDSNDTRTRVQPTAYAISQGAATSTQYKTSSGMAAGWWWLRSPGDKPYFAAHVQDSGLLGRDNVFMVHPNSVVRPAFWLNLESDIF